MSDYSVRFELIMDAGNGAQKSGDILISAFAKSGNFVYIEPMIPAEISPPKRTKYSMSGVVIRVANFDVTNIGSGTDLMLFEHEILLQTRLDDKEYLPGATVLIDMGDEARNKDAYKAAIDRAESLGLKVIPFNMDDDSKKIMQDLGGNGKNMFYLGMLTRIFNVSKDQLKDAIRSTFKKLPEEKLNQNINIFENGYTCAGTCQISYTVPVAPIESDRILIDGNTSLSMGVIDAGIKIYCGYPITPASSIMHTLAKYIPQYGGLVHQAEDEISAIGAAIGSYYAGTPSITATSGPGYSLKQEFIGLAQSTETPLIVVDVQRSGPSTGMPTKTEQSDLFTAVFGCHGDNTKVVISVANVIDCFYVPHIARYITETLRVPVIILSDYLTSVSYKIIKNPPLVQMDHISDIKDFVFERFRLKPLPEVEMVKKNQSEPGDAGLMRRVTGLNTDPSGAVSTTAESNSRAHAIRNEKLNILRQALQKPEMFGDDEGDVLVVGWGSSRGAIEEAINSLRKENLKVSGAHLKIVYPLPPMMKDILKRFKHVVTAEIAYGDEYKASPLAMLLRNETLIDVKSTIGSASGRPITPHEVVTKVKELV